MFWQTSRRRISLDRPLVMGILNVTPDSFSDGGEYVMSEEALKRAERMIDDGVDIIDIGGESTRPGGATVDPEVEVQRTEPVVQAIAKRFDIPISIDTTKWIVAKAAIDAGAEIINDISGLRWDARLADLAANTEAGLILMHSRGNFETMHSEPPVADICAELRGSLTVSIETAKKRGVRKEQIALDIGIGFGKTFEQNLELLAKLGSIVNEFKSYPMLIGTSRKSFIGKILGGAPPLERLGGSLATALIVVQRGAKIVRVHDVKETVAALAVAREIELRD
ncbi:MAG: dihydropteroate synthase [Pyrinomonadaceae bacterium]|nr:dihydropteroate synthase [Pyrinomonadaceae bacterium]